MRSPNGHVTAARHRRRKWRRRGRGAETDVGEDFIWCGRDELTEERRNFRQAVDWVQRESLGDGGTHRVQLELARSDDAEVRACSADAPKEVGVFVIAHVQQPSLGRDDIYGEQVVDREAQLALKS